jgi:hypothetical protein
MSPKAIMRPGKRIRSVRFREFRAHLDTAREKSISPYRSRGRQARWSGRARLRPSRRHGGVGALSRCARELLGGTPFNVHFIREAQWGRPVVSAPRQSVAFVR